MKLEKAIEIGHYIQEAETIMWAEPHYTALKLLIEAGNQVLESRFDPSTWEPKLLPGETEE